MTTMRVAQTHSKPASKQASPTANERAGREIRHSVWTRKLLAARGTRTYRDVVTKTMILPKILRRPFISKSEGGQH